MAEQIYTIPINEAFDRGDGCPLCALKAQLEQSSLEYIMGAAMMEPDVRIETNRLGFCRRHFDEMLAMRNRLSLALMLESHLSELSALIAPSQADGKKPAKLRKNQGDDSPERITSAAESCFVCARAKGFEEKYVSNVVHMWKKDEEFRQKLSGQRFFCLEHYGAILACAKSSLSEDGYISLSKTLSDIERRYLEELYGDVSGFCRSFDHQNAGKPLTDGQRTAVERACAFLSGV